jgi:hypothetical protein
MMKCAAVSCAMLVAACVSEPIEWDAPRDIPGTIGATTRLVMDERATPGLVAAPAPVVALSPRACNASVTTTRARAAEWYAAWFIARPDSSVVLVVGRSTDDGATWSPYVVADERDRGRRGCSRPRPALDADSVRGYVHLAYFIEPADGAGVWYTHSLERGTLWHQTIGVLYGEEPVAASIASGGDTVLVAYEHPGSRGARVGVAISRQAGHTFAERLRVVRVSGRARDPRIAFREGRVALAWVESPADRGTSAAARTRLLVGRFR